jgi:hypothetical protein
VTLTAVVAGKELPVKIRDVSWPKTWYFVVTAIVDSTAVGYDNHGLLVSYPLYADGFEPYVAAATKVVDTKRTALKHASYRHACRQLMAVPSTDFEAGVRWLMRKLKAEAKRRQRLSPDVASFLANVSAGLKKVR